MPCVTEWDSLQKNLKPWWIWRPLADLWACYDRSFGWHGSVWWINACSVEIEVDVNVSRTMASYKVKHTTATEVNHLVERLLVGGAIRDPLSGRSYVCKPCVSQVLVISHGSISETRATINCHNKWFRQRLVIYSSYSNQVVLRFVCSYTSPRLRC